MQRCTVLVLTGLAALASAPAWSQDRPRINGSRQDRMRYTEPILAHPGM